MSLAPVILSHLPFAFVIAFHFLLPAFTVIGVAAWYLRHGCFVNDVKVMIAMGVILASVLMPTQALLGDLQMGAVNPCKQRLNRRLLRC